MSYMQAGIVIDIILDDLVCNQVLASPYCNKKNGLRNVPREWPLTQVLEERRW